MTDAAYSTLQLKDLVGRNVAILGAGREGLATARALKQLAPGQPLTFYAEAAPEAQAEIATEDKLVVAPLRADALLQHDVLIRSPGFSPYREALALARERGARFTTATNLWMAANPTARTLCVTGTKGKSTSCALLVHLLAAAGKRVAMAGNMGSPLIACDASSADWWVVELSSYQICDLQHAPWLSLITNLSDEHLDWHGGARRYRDDKLRLASLTPHGKLFANGACASLRAELIERDDTRWFHVPRELPVAEAPQHDVAPTYNPMPQAPGPHNLQNLAGALAVVDYLDSRPAELGRVLADFRGLPHRLRSVGALRGRRLIDDSLSTTPVSTLAALAALGEAAPVTLLVGGTDRGVDWQPHVAAFRAAAPHAMVGLPDSGPAILATLEAGGLAPPGGLSVAQNLDQALAQALERTPCGGVILLSPGAASFPHYQDYADRAAAFLAAAQALG
jgi:UDP-N-acetylmuramoylalanine--D-glutamate ligase